jgi:macrolide transport system ATP-binding/permease protein
MIETIMQDLRYELRALLKSPRFTSIALLTLVLGIAANVAIFTFVDAALLRPLPYRDASRLVEVYDTRKMEVFTQFESSYPDFLDWRAQQQVFDGLAGYGQNQVLLRGGTAPELLASAAVTDNFFQTLGVQPLWGRDFRAGEDLAVAPRMVMLSYGWWQRHFGGKDVIGQTLSIDNEPNTIIGVLPADFHFAPVGDPDVWVTLHVTGALQQRRNLHWLSVVGRLKPGVSRPCLSHAQHAVWNPLMGPCDLCWGNGNPGDCYAGGQLCARASRDEGRSDGGVKVRVSAGASRGSAYSLMGED